MENIARNDNTWFRKIYIPILLFWEEHFKTKISSTWRAVQILAFFPLYFEISANFSRFWAENYEKLSQKLSYRTKIGLNCIFRFHSTNKSVQNWKEKRSLKIEFQWTPINSKSHYLHVENFKCFTRRFPCPKNIRLWLAFFNRSLIASIWFSLFCVCIIVFLNREIYVAVFACICYTFTKSFAHRYSRTRIYEFCDLQRTFWRQIWCFNYEYFLWPLL